MTESRNVSKSWIAILALFMVTGAAGAATVTLTASGNWTAPAGVTSVTVEAWGGGGGGGAATGNPAKGGGGAGGQYARKVVTVVPGTTYAIVVGAGGTVGAAVAGGAGGNSTFAATSVVAQGGVGGALCSANSCTALGGLGSVTGGVGDVVFAGGNGSDGVGATGVGGAGGGGAGSSAAGGNAAGDTAGTGTSVGGGVGGAGLTARASGNPGAIAGGGGGAGYATNNTDRSGGAGAAGQVILSYATAPVVTTNAATALTTTSAKLNGTVDDSGASTTVSFDYGLTVAYGSTVTSPQSPLGAGYGATPVTATASGLSCGTTYHFRVKGTNSIGTTNGVDMTFTTTACPTGVSVTASPGLCANDASFGAVAWTLLDAMGSDNVYASTVLNDNQQSNYLKCTGYGFAIPAGATINGITVNLERSATNTLVQDLRMRLVKAGVIQAGDRALLAVDYPTVDAVAAHGGAADLWGGVWTVADINNANFGAALATIKNGTAGGTRTVNVDHMPITVTYTPTTPWVASITRVSANPTAANTSVSWDVLFSGNALGVDAGDFQLVMGGAATGATITSVSGGGQVWTVTANTGTGATGTLGLNLVDNNSITIGGAPLGGAGAGNGNYSGQVYTIEVPVCDGTAIFCDDFERSNPGVVGNGWTVTPAPAAVCTGAVGNTGCAGIDSDIPPFNGPTLLRPNPTRALFTRWSIVSVDSRVIDLSTYPSALLNFWMRRGGDTFSEYPEAAGEDYLVQYLASDGTWKVLAQYPTGVLQGQVYTPSIQLPADAMHAGFRLRFYQPAGSGDAGGAQAGGSQPGIVGYDYWHFDNVIIREAPESSYVGAFCDNFEAGLGRWSISAEGAPGLPPAVAIGDALIGTTDFSSTTSEMDMRWGYVVASTLRTDITGVNGNITYWVKSGTTAVRDPDANENLVVEYRNSAGTWTSLATYLGADLAGTIYNGSHVIPADAKHAGFRLRFRMLNGSAFDNDYWHIDDVCVGASLTNVDLALAKSHVGTITPGGQATYTLAVSNAGINALAGSISVVDTLPTGLTYYSASGTSWTCSANGQDVTCSYVGTLNGGATAPAITLIADVDPGASGTLTNTATVTGSAPDATTTNNTATDSVILTPGFVFTDAPCVHALPFGDPGQTCNLITWSPQTAGQDLSSIYITKVNTLGRPSHYLADTVVNFEFGLTCHNPVANAGVQATFTAAGSTLPLCEGNGATPTTWSTGVDRTFTANSTSIGPYVFNYADVGQIELEVRNSVATTQAGSSGAFVVKPANFVLSAIKCTTADAASCGAGALAMPTSGDNPAAGNAGGGAFIKAGQPFSVTVTAVDVNGNATPNYGKESTAESVKLTTSLVGGLGLVSNPALNGTFGAFTSGVATGTAFSWDEVGIITLTPSVKDGNYLGVGDLTGTVSGNVGRFYPDHFDTVVTQSAGVPMACPSANGLTCTADYNGIVYSGQQFTLTVTAKNAGGNTTVNYVDTPLVPATDFAKNGTLSALSAVGVDSTPTGAGTLGLASITAFAAGVATTVAEKYTFDTSNTAPTNVYIRAVDTDGVNSKRLVAPTTTSIEGGVTLVSGRLLVGNTYGSNLLPLSLAATVQYYTATGWVTSLTDSITKLSLPASLAVGTGTTAVSTVPASHVVAAGKLTINLGKPTGGEGVVTVTPSVDAASPGQPVLAIVSGTATFGVFKKRNEFIYQRESY